MLYCDGDMRSFSRSAPIRNVAGFGALIVGLWGCTGTIGEPSGQALSSDQTPPTEQPTDPGPEPETACSTSPGHVPLHRLTKREFNAAMTTLFGVRGDFATLLPSDTKVARYDNNAASQQVTDALTEGYLAASERVMQAVQADTDARARLLTCSGSDELACARATIAQLAPVAFRRAISDSEVDALLEPYRNVRGLDLSYEAGVTASLRALIVAPDFLFRTYGVDGQPPAVPVESTGSGEVVRLNGREFVTRLAAFIWGSVPDAALMAQAAAGDFDDRHLPQTQATIRATIRTMLQDPRATSLIDAFFTPHLHLDMFEASYRAPDRNIFPEWDDALEAAVRTETRTFLAKLIENDESPTNLLTADYSYVNRDLAEKLYGLPGEGFNDSFQRTTLPTERRGIVTHPMIMSMTSNPNATSIVNRGLWVMENVMCLPTPTDAPPGVPTETPEIEGASIRERLEAHRSDPSCAVCHATMDPLGFGLENFGPLGRFRMNDDDGFPVDAQGELPDGRTFSGSVELVDMIARSGEFKFCMTRNLMEYAVGRRFTLAVDKCTVEGVAEKITDDSPLSEWVFQIAMSSPFSYQQIQVNR